MQKARRGHIVVLSSVAGLSGGARVPLSTAQFAVQGLAESLHMEFRRTNSNIITTLVHVYPFIVGPEVARDIRLRYLPDHCFAILLKNIYKVINKVLNNRIPSYFGTMPASDAARRILDGVRRNYAEFSVPGYLLYLGHLLRLVLYILSCLKTTN